MTTTAHAPSPGQAVVPSPRPRHPAVVEVTLTALHTAIRFSGLLARYTTKRGGPDHLADAAQRAALELVARAVETTGNPDPHPRYSDLGELHLIGIRISHTGQGVLIEVWDSDPTPTHDAHLDSHLSTLEEVSQRWGCYLPNSSGKVIWAELTTGESHHGHDR